MFSSWSSSDSKNIKLKKVKLLLCLIEFHTMKAHGTVKVLLSSALNGGECSASGSGHSTCGGRVPYVLDTDVVLVRQYITVQKMGDLPVLFDKPVLIHRSHSLSPSHYTTVENKYKVKLCSLVKWNTSQVLVMLVFIAMTAINLKYNTTSIQGNYATQRQKEE